ncbi:MAG TPA: protein-tyrosine-phosphatase [Gammaproteobacteria bacterium]|jgi:hypothetical protein|nr:metallophosphoesterase [Gammaproteobacteria bacterium]MDP6732078.1 metallophosphoesterase [Gammaproteobacteria bacterium]HAJ76504.1 protein-tyrosine-phosphatase [Gammaproteobacteria bacterium]
MQAILTSRVLHWLPGVTLTLVFLLQSVYAAEDQWQGVERIVAIGDIHGDYDHFKEVLTGAGLINRRGNWTAGNTHFVQVGDLSDRGPDTDKIIQHMQKLERQAPRDGGMVHALIGNHEAMNVLGDLRYVHPGEYEALRSRRARRLRDDMYSRHIEQVSASNPEFVADDAYHDRFNTIYPLGFVEHRIAWSPEGEFGAWVAGHNTVVKINRTLFMHAGISPAVLGMTITDINDQIRADLNGESGEVGGLSQTEEGPLWYRGLARGAEAPVEGHLEAVLEFYDVDRLVLGHTPGLGTVVPRFDGRVLVIDTGISDYYGAHVASLLIEGDDAFTVQADLQLAIPKNLDETISYFKTVAEFKSNLPALEQYINYLESPAEQTLPDTAVPDPAL